MKEHTLHLISGPLVGSDRIAPHAGQKSGSTMNSCSRLLSFMAGKVDMSVRVCCVELEAMVGLYKTR